MKPQAILHLDLDTFFVSVERLLDSQLQHKPILVGGLGDRGVVAACSYETRSYGIHSGMSMQVARKLCPQAIVIKGNASTYTQYSHLVTEIIRAEVPAFEKASVDEFYVDLTGMDRFFGTQQFAFDLRKKIIAESGLPISVGLSQNKVVSKIATGEAKPNNERYIPQGTEKHFLAPLSTRKIPMVGQKTYTKLVQMGIQRIQTLQEMPLAVIEQVLGKNGKTIWLRAQGIDNSPIIPYHERKSISMERTFNRDTIDVVRLKNSLQAMAESLAYQLRNAQKLTSIVTVKIRYSDYQTQSKQTRIAYTSADHLLVPQALALFDQLYQRRVLIRLIGLKFSGLVGGHHQIDLFDDSQKLIDLYQSIDKIKNRFGERSILKASTLDSKSIGGMGNPFNGEPPMVLAHRKQ
ncbi:DNA polymerase IV [Mesonia sp. HuA40]|uniref:DNA polymerase IV n=1 Tax=Mesonia sp. HuA40 TaxID=2602761 RepID=UPI0011C91BD0|nr:DNA polymerase IV [Mesonia sp. HuA40]TXK74780.1 DNA polymerase IV [Mesonia sp. HuA40]